MTEEIKTEKYINALGRRKTAVATIRLYESPEQKVITINNKDVNAYFEKNVALVDKVVAPLKLLKLENKFKITIKVNGGGVVGQAEAIRLGISRALLKMNEAYKAELKVHGYLTRDSREVERKKPGLKKARRAPQWQKR